jgi:hypothetical protein
MANGSGKCYFHGGKGNPVGIKSPNFKTGRYSKVLGKGARALYEDTRDDPELISLREELSLLQVRLNDLAGRAAIGKGGLERWQELQERWQGVLALLGQGAPIAPAAAVALAGVTDLISGAVDAESAWLELGETMELKSRLSAKEWRRQTDLQNLITSERAMALIMAIMLSVRQHVQDKLVQALIADDVHKLLRQTQGRREL